MNAPKELSDFEKVRRATVFARARREEEKSMNELVRFFRNEAVDWGIRGDHENWSPERTAIEMIRSLQAEVRQPLCPQCEVAGIKAVAHLNERIGGEGFYLASWWCPNGHEWSVRSKPWGRDQRAILRGFREASGG